MVYCSAVLTTPAASAWINQAMCCSPLQAAGGRQLYTAATQEPPCLLLLLRLILPATAAEGTSNQGRHLAVHLLAITCWWRRCCWCPPRTQVLLVWLLVMLGRVPAPAAVPGCAGPLPQQGGAYGEVCQGGHPDAHGHVGDAGVRGDAAREVGHALQLADERRHHHQRQVASIAWGGGTDRHKWCELACTCRWLRSYHMYQQVPLKQPVPMKQDDTWRGCGNVKCVAVVDRMQIDGGAPSCSGLSLTQSSCGHHMRPQARRRPQQAQETRPHQQAHRHAAGTGSRQQDDVQTYTCTTGSVSADVVTGVVVDCCRVAALYPAYPVPLCTS
jgi:hypothetical protein